MSNILTNLLKESLQSIVHINDSLDVAC